LINFITEHFEVDSQSITFKDNLITFSKGEISFSELANLAYMNRISLSSTGYYATPKIHYDRAKGEGRPFFYYAHGVA
ncbi:molybdopterin cofactor-binding domain-containing protein, partial [Pseudoalteromonas sp. MER144-MNA-CIBAN-0113]